ncbi:hypothetical protein E4U38_006105 [Claviceps purpurea]|nr:hypothetical protein E4U38_006105 [Claviceps purpurea]
MATPLSARAPLQATSSISSTRRESMSGSSPYKDGGAPLHMIFMSWGGFRLEEDKLEELEVLHELAWADEGIDTLHAVHKEGVLHCDFNKPEADSHTKEGMTMTTEQRQTWANIVKRVDDENDDIVSIILDSLSVEY